MVGKARNPVLSRHPARFCNALGRDDGRAQCQVTCGTGCEVTQGIVVSHVRATGRRRMIRLLVFTTLYPNAARPHHGIFVEQRLRHLVASGKVAARVVAPVPWFPSSNPRFGRYAAFASVPRFEHRYGIPVWHPRYPVIPRVGMALAPCLLAAASGPTLDSLRREADFDVIDAHYFYPDGVAAVWHARRLNKPVFVTGRGSDLNVIPRYAVPRRAIAWAARRAAAAIVVSRSLVAPLQALNVPASRIVVLPNGVDLALFRPGSADALERDFGLAGPVLLSVGHLVEGKGHDIAVAALARLTGFGLVIIGEGPESVRLREQVRAQRLESRVRFAGAVPHARLAEYYRAAFAVLLASRREGMPNVVLESLASGTPVVATAVGGIPDVLCRAEAGRLVTARTAAAFADAVADLAADYPDRAATRRHAEQFGWAATTRGQLDLLGRTLDSFAAAAG